MAARVSRRAAAEKGSENLRTMQQLTLQFAPDGKLQAGQSPKAFKISEIVDDWDKYCYGSILRCRLINFQKYNDAIFRPGPYMNMIIGPNGTGKSTFVAAIALGLGFQPSVLGRSKNVTEFIKYNCGSCSIELVLKCEQPGESASPPFVTIKRVMRRVNEIDCESDFYINGNLTTQKAVVQCATELGAQITNLCQFLPQDKVSEFAQMSPEQVLIETMKAAASEETFKQFNELVELRKQERSHLKNLESDTKDLENDQRNMNKLEETRRRAAEREERRKKVDLLKKKRPWVLYNNERDHYYVLKEQYEKLKAEFDSATIEADQDLFNEIQRVQTALKQSLRKLKQFSVRVRGTRQEVESMHSESFLLGNRIEEKKKEILEHRELIAMTREKYEKDRREFSQLEVDIDRLKVESESDDLRTNVEAADREFKRVSDECRDVKTKISELNSEKESIMEKSSRLRHSESKLFKEIEEIRSIRKRKLEALYRLNRDTHSAYCWLEENRKHFRGNIHGPIGLDITVKDDKMAQSVESVISRSILVGFVCENTDDFDEFAKICDEKGWRTVNSILLKDTTTDPNALPACPWSKRELKELGFDCVLSDLIEGPPMIIWALHELSKIHLIPVSISSSIDIPACEKVRNLMKFVSKQFFYEIRHSRYSDSDAAIRSAPLKSGCLLTVDIGASNDSDLPRLQRKMDSIREQLNQEQEAMRSVLEKISAAEKTLDQLKVRKEELDELKKAALIKKAGLKKKELALAKLYNSLRDSRKILQSENEEEELLENLKNLIYERREIISNLKNMLKQLNEEIILAGIEDFEHRLLKLQFDQLEASRNQKRGLHENLRRRVENAAEEVAASKERAQIALQVAGMEQLSKDAQKLFSTLPDKLEDLDKEILEEEAKLRAAGSGDRFGQQDLDELERKTVSIRELQERIKLTGIKIEELENKINEIYPIWRQSIDEMISTISDKFSNFMSKLNNSGRVELGIPMNPSDYDNYNLVILVKFRSEEELRRLTAQRQSGGEKSVSTILYLMSLQELSRSPFRVVDEINQGMDVVNERKVHDLMVETATSLQGKHAQYFLITPKLLTGLEYNEKMHILCIYNGQGMLN